MHFDETKPLNVECLRRHIVYRKMICEIFSALYWNKTKSLLLYYGIIMVPSNLLWKIYRIDVGCL